jgi:hypothetical protein
MAGFWDNVEIEQRGRMVFHLASVLGVENRLLVQFEIEEEGCWV